MPTLCPQYNTAGRGGLLFREREGPREGGGSETVFGLARSFIDPSHALSFTASERDTERGVEYSSLDLTLPTLPKLRDDSRNRRQQWLLATASFVRRMPR